MGVPGGSGLGLVGPEPGSRPQSPRPSPSGASNTFTTTRREKGQRFLSHRLRSEGLRSEGQRQHPEAKPRCGQRCVRAALCLLEALGGPASRLPLFSPRSGQLIGSRGHGPPTGLPRASPRRGEAWITRRTCLLPSRPPLCRSAARRCGARTRAHHAAPSLPAGGTAAPRQVTTCGRGFAAPELGGSPVCGEPPAWGQSSRSAWQPKARPDSGGATPAPTGPLSLAFSSAKPSPLSEKTIRTRGAQSI